MRAWLVCRSGWPRDHKDMLLAYDFQVLGLRAGVTTPNACIILMGQFIGNTCQQEMSFLVSAPKIFLSGKAGIH